MALKGFIELLRLEHMAKSRQVERQQGMDTPWQGVAFCVAGLNFVAPIGEVTEVISFPNSLTEVPMSKPWLLGIANIRGQLLPLVDLASFVNLSGTAEQLNRRKVLVVKQQDIAVGLLVDTVWHIKNFLPKHYLPEHLPAGAPFLPYTHGQFVTDTELEAWPIFRPSLLLADPRFLEVSL
ncbi:chemotaxis protein CheW [Psychrobacter sanguinis]|uniref:Chemotaxis protein CheW n=2 Tax=Psychrobacter TaxID=497 RepID=A0A844M119_9GAMM|nr:chemotaxis protein CheW [Psychrobacter sanguinis]